LGTGIIQCCVIYGIVPLAVNLSAIDLQPSSGPVSATVARAESEDLDALSLASKSVKARAESAI